MRGMDEELNVRYIPYIQNAIMDERLSAQPHSITTYFTDTNCYRYASAITNGADSKEMEVKRIYKAVTKRFWDKIITETSQGEAIILTCDEVIQELKVQSHTLQGKEKKQIEKLVSQVEVDNTLIPQHLEYKLRELSNVMRSRYGKFLTNPPRAMDYLRTSDARIFISSYLNDAILATANIKDFLLYPLFFGEEEKKLYDILNEEYVMIAPKGRELVEQDPLFQEFVELIKTIKE